MRFERAKGLSATETAMVELMDRSDQVSRLITVSQGILDEVRERDAASQARIEFLEGRVKDLDKFVYELMKTERQAHIRRRGKVRWYSAKKGYGFITADDGSDFFFHHTGLAWHQLEAEPSAGVPVTFTPHATRRTTEARAVVLHGDAKPRDNGKRHRRPQQQGPVKPLSPQPPAVAENGGSPVTSTADRHGGQHFTPLASRLAREQPRRPVTPPAQTPALAGTASPRVTSSAGRHIDRGRQQQSPAPLSRSNAREPPPAARSPAVQSLTPPSVLGSVADEESSSEAASYSSAESCSSLPDEDWPPPPAAAFYSSAESCPSLSDDDASSSPATEPKRIAPSDRHHLRHHPRVVSPPPAAGRKDVSSGLTGTDLHNLYLESGLQKVMSLVASTGPAASETSATTERERLRRRHSRVVSSPPAVGRGDAPSDLAGNCTLPLHAQPTDSQNQDLLCFDCGGIVYSQDPPYSLPNCVAFS